MSIPEIIIVIVTGFVAGFINTIAGGGSMLTLPVLIFLGMPSAVANGTNRIGILTGAISSVAGFRRKGVQEFPYSLWLGLASIPGAVLGALSTQYIPDSYFNRVLAVILVLMVMQMLVKGKGPSGLEDNFSPSRKTMGVLSFFLIGFYGGFIQVGIGFLIIGLLYNLHRTSLMRINAIKVFVVLLYTPVALVVFAMNDQIAWVPGSFMAVGSLIGGWFASQWSANQKQQRLVSLILTLMVLIFAVKLWVES